MRLFLASEAKHPKSIERFKKYIGTDIKRLKIAYVPTAANGEYYGAWKGGRSIQVAMSLCADLKIVELEDSSYKDVIKQIKGADILWMAGGMSGYLLYWIRRVELDKALPEILNSGTIYLGSSAGSMICAKTQYSAEWYLGESEPGCSLLPGLGYIDFEIYPHFEENQKQEIDKKWEKGSLYLLRDGEAITVEDDKIKILGKKRIITKP